MLDSLLLNLTSCLLYHPDSLYPTVCSHSLCHSLISPRMKHRAQHSLVDTVTV